jgi:hypothetical protein
MDRGGEAGRGGGVGERCGEADCCGDAERCGDICGIVDWRGGGVVERGDSADAAAGASSAAVLLRGETGGGGGNWVGHGPSAASANDMRLSEARIGAKTAPGFELPFTQKFARDCSAAAGALGIASDCDLDRERCRNSTTVGCASGTREGDGDCERAFGKGSLSSDMAARRGVSGEGKASPFVSPARQVRHKHSISDDRRTGLAVTDEGRRLGAGIL